jgi:hypothetical protein
MTAGNILIVDDDVRSACRMFELLAHEGFEPECALKRSGSTRPPVAAIVVPVNSDQIDKLGVVAHQSFSFRTRSNGRFRLPWRSLLTRAALQLEIALRHQIGVLQCSVKRPKLTAADRCLWAWLCSVWNGWEARVSSI